MSTNEERIGGYRLRKVGDALIVDERATHPLVEVPRVLFGLGFMAPACVLVGAMALPGGLLGVRSSDEARQIPVANWFLISVFLCIPVAFFLIGFFYAFARVRVVARPGGLAIGSSWLGLMERLKTYSAANGAALKLAPVRRGVFGGCSAPLVLTNAGAEQAELLACHNENDVRRIAEVIACKIGIPVLGDSSAGPASGSPT